MPPSVQHLCAITSNNAAQHIKVAANDKSGFRAVYILFRVKQPLDFSTRKATGRFNGKLKIIYTYRNY